MLVIRASRPSGTPSPAAAASTQALLTPASTAAPRWKASSGSQAAKTGAAAPRTPPRQAPAAQPRRQPGLAPPLHEPRGAAPARSPGRLAAGAHAQRAKTARWSPPGPAALPPAHHQRPGGPIFMLGADDSGFTLLHRLRQPRSNASAARPPSPGRPAGNVSWPSSAKRRAATCGRVSAATALRHHPGRRAHPATCRLR